MSQLVPILIEALFVEVIKHKMKPFLITSIYRPPNSKVDFMDNLENYFNELDKQNSELIISEDLNCDLSISDLQPQSCKLMDIFRLFQLKQLIADPTRITDDTESLLDITNNNIKNAQLILDITVENIVKMSHNGLLTDNFLLL